MATANPNQEEVSRAASYLKLTNETQFEKAVMFVGAVGAGKSTLCNFLVKRENFETADKPVAVTKEAKCDIFPFEGHHYMIVDCPGFLETKKENEEKVLRELCRAGVMARDGVDAMALVINLVERFSDEHHEQAIDILNTLGVNFWNYMFIIFTHEDEMKAQASSSEKYIETKFRHRDTSELLIQIYEQVNHRHMNVESKRPASDTNYWEQKCRELIGHMKFISDMNDNTRYESALMSKGKEFYFKCVDLKTENHKLQEEIAELKVRMDKEVEKKEELEKQLDTLNNRVPVVNKKLEEEVADYEKNMGEQMLSQKSINILFGASLVGVATLVGVTLLKGLLK